MPKHYDLLPPHQYYHVFNRAVENEKLFLNEENQRFFLQKFNLHLLPVCDVLCYVLLPNHFHLMIKVKSIETLEDYYIQKKKIKMPACNNEAVSGFVMEQFSNWCNSYTKSFNKVFLRKGKLFMDHLHRTQIIGENYFTKVIHYIHANPVHHGYTKQISNWKFSSYNAIISNSSTRLLKQEILDWFGGVDAFIKFHSQPVDLKLNLPEY